MDPRPLTIALVTPSPRHSNQGNRITALRWARLLRGLGQRVFVEQEWSGRACDLMVALHASRSARSVEKFRSADPARPVVVMLTGTDLLGDDAQRATALATLERADRIVLLQPRAVDEIPEALRAKTRVVRQSAQPPRVRAAPAADAFEVAVVAHLRDVKDPFRPALAARLLPASSRLRVLHAGEALDTALGVAAEREARENARWRWLGARSHRASVELIARCRLLVVPSRLEGGANVIAEALAAGTPVVASRIAGAVGTLGSAYPGLFEAGDEHALAQLLTRCEAEPSFLAALATWCERLRPLVAPERERAAIADLVDELLPGRARPRAVNAARDDAAQRTTLLGAAEPAFVRLAEDVRAGLRATPKRLPCCWFYDEAGSRLFEEICATPEYYVTRAEDELLATHADAIVAAIGPGATVVELGSGSATKTRRILDALARRDASARRRDRHRYVMVDISPSALRESARALARDYPALEVVGLTAEYDEGLARLATLAPAPRLVLWLGSNVGNFHRADAAAFLARLRRSLAPGDALLLGADLRKELRVLERAYDDAAGATARFNLNLLARINRELGADFDLAAFRHRAVYEEPEGRIVMWLDAQRDMTVRIALLDLTVTIAKGESLHTENSYKYSTVELDRLADGAGLRVAGRWFDRARRFSETLLVVAAGAPGGAA